MIEKIEVLTSEGCMSMERLVADAVYRFQSDGLHVEIQYSYAYSDLNYGDKFSAMIIGRKK